ncbi:MAG: DUF4163 domain-containing protein [Pyrinomonadaceae bacterium]|nr:DUF4163 domain-containing protein [Pyrinomonadaceae bacterium]
MQRLILVFLAVLALTTYAGQPIRVSAGLLQDRLIVRPRRIVLVRSAKLAKQFPDRKTATVTYPVISGLGDRAVLRRIRSLLDFKNIFDYSLQEYRDDAWLSEFSYTVNYNRNFLFDITFNQNGVAAYPDDQSKHFLINLKNGRIIKAADAFLVDKFGALAALVDQKLQAELKEITTEAKVTSNLEATEFQSIVEGLEQMKFGPEHLEDFEVGAQGITFLYDAGLPHAIQAFEPEGRYFFSYSELTPYLNPTGPLGQFVR